MQRERHACTVTDRNADGKTDMQRNGQARTVRTDRHTHSGQGRRQIPRQAGSDGAIGACVRATDRSCMLADQNLHRGRDTNTCWNNSKTHRQDGHKRYCLVYNVLRRKIYVHTIYMMQMPDTHEKMAGGIGGNKRKGIYS